MTPQDFRRLRKRIGTQQEVADDFGVSESLIQKMEVGGRAIRPVYWMALCWLAQERLGPGSGTVPHARDRTGPHETGRDKGAGSSEPPPYSAQ